MKFYKFCCNIIDKLMNLWFALFALAYLKKFYPCIVTCALL